MEFRILGPLDVLDDRGATTPLRGSRERALLVHLLLSANRVVPVERLGDELCPGRSPEQAARTVQVYVSRLRSALRAAGADGVVVTRPPGYLVVVDPAAIDAVRFEALVVEGREELRGGNPSRAAETLRQALALWRGPALADSADTPRARAEAARLEEARLAALEERIAADLACGRHADLVAELDGLTRTHPLRERLWGQRMVALHRSGRQADALRAYRNLQATLRELGLEPGAELARLEGAVLRREAEVEWPPAGTAAASVATMPLPGLLTELGSVFVGRRDELARLEGLWNEAVAGARRLAFVSGEPGVGKTRLAAEFAAGVGARGATVIAGRCDDLGVPYQPFVDALRHYVDHTPPDLLGPATGGAARELVRIHPELAERIPGLAPPSASDPDTERYRLFEGVAAWLAAASRARPLLLVLDDLQWATRPTLQLLRHIMRSPQPGRVLVLATYRDTELAPDHPLIETRADLRRQQRVEDLALDGLPPAEVVEFFAHAVGHELDDDAVALARAVHGQTQGNPFFVREVLRDLRETGRLRRVDGRYRVGVPGEEVAIPEGVRDVVGRRLARLSAPAGDFLRAAAVVGVEFDPALAATVAALEGEAFLVAFDEAILARLVVEVPGRSGGARFVHAIVRDTLYRSQSAARRAEAHRKVAEAMEAGDAPADDELAVLAAHWAQAGLSSATVAKAVDYAGRAGDRALARLAHDEAAAHYAGGLDVLDAAGADTADRRRLELLIRQGEAQRRAGDAAYRRTLLDAARLASRLGDRAALATAALANSRGHIYSAGLGVDTERVDVLHAALEAVGETDTRLRARLLANLGLELAWEPDPRRRLDLSREALRLAKALDDPATLAHVLLARDYTITAPHNAAERLAASSDALAAADRIGDGVLASRALILRFKAAMEMADVAEAERSLARNEALVGDLGQPALTWGTLHQRAGLAVLRGEPGAEAAVTAAHEFAVAAGQADIEFFSGTQRFSLYRDQGRLDELHDWVADVVARTGNPTAKGLYAVTLAEAGDVAGATGVFDELASTGFGHPTNNVNWLRFTADCAWLCARLGRAEHAPELRRRLEPHADQLVVISLGAATAGSVSFYLALLAAVTGDVAEAAARFAAAEATHASIGSPAWLDRTLFERDRMLDIPVR